MPNRYIHMHVAREAIHNLSANTEAGNFFIEGTGLSADEISKIAQNEPTYLAFGAIGPDFFFSLPDFRPPLGYGLWWGIYLGVLLEEGLQRDIITPYEEEYEETYQRSSDIQDTASGGQRQQARAIDDRKRQLLRKIIVALASTQYDLAGFTLGSVPKGFDEALFPWNDMLHYRKTFEFARTLWEMAEQEQNETWKNRFRAFALGWMSHCAADTTGHAFVNTKVGGPYRLHWGRHALVENHMDTWLYEQNYKNDERYNHYAASALHLWLAFEKGTGASMYDLFEDNEGAVNKLRPEYELGQSDNARRDRQSKWDCKAALPSELAKFIVDALQKVYPVDGIDKTPQIIADIKPGSKGYPSPDDLQTAYEWFMRNVKSSTTFLDNYAPPQPPEFLNKYIDLSSVPLPPLPEGAIGSGPPDYIDSLEDLSRAIFALLAMLDSLTQYPRAVDANIHNFFNSISSFPERWGRYIFEELPLYQALLSVHWFLSMKGLATPLPWEISYPLVCIGRGIDIKVDLETALFETYGGIIDIVNIYDSPDQMLHPDPVTPFPFVSAWSKGVPEQSGREKDYPRETVTDPPGTDYTLMSQSLHVLSHPLSENHDAEIPTQFVKPWKYPSTDLNNNHNPSEKPSTVSGPFKTGDDPRVLIDNRSGDNETRKNYQESENQDKTDRLNENTMNRNLGGPVDFTCYVMAQLTRNEVPEKIANFNLDADRSYGSLCWDWERSIDNHFSRPTDYLYDRTEGHLSFSKKHHDYLTPLSPGYGWDASEKRSEADEYTEHQPWANHRKPVKIKFL